MGFSRKRGRPKINRSKKDIGTKELRHKHSLGLTSEPLDLCLKREIVNTDEHDAGLRLRWLYTLRFGSPDISSYNPEDVGKSCGRYDDEEWLHARSVEYGRSLCELQDIGAKRIVMNICIFNSRPSFLMPLNGNITRREAFLRHSQMLKFCEGLELLSKLFGKKS